MKVLRGFGIAILSIVLFFTVMSLMVSISLKDIVQNKFMVTAFKEGLKESVPEENKKEVEPIIDQVMSYPETNEIIESVLYDIVNYDQTKGMSDKTIDLVIQFCKNHKEDYEKLTGEEVDINDIDTPESRQALKDGFNEVMEDEYINDSDAELITNIINVYSSATSTKLVKILIVSIIIIIGLIGVLSWSYYKWLQPVGIVSIIASVFTFLYYGGLSFISTALNESTSFKVTFASNEVLYTAIIELIVGITFVVLCSVFTTRERQALQNTQVTTV